MRRFFRTPKIPYANVKYMLIFSVLVCIFWLNNYFLNCYFSNENTFIVGLWWIILSYFDILVQWIECHTMVSEPQHHFINVLLLIIIRFGNFYQYVCGSPHSILRWIALCQVMRPIWNAKSISVVCHVIYVHLPLDSGCQLQIIIMASSIIYFKLFLLIKMWSRFSVSTVTFLFYWSTRHSAMVCKAVSLFNWKNGVELCFVLPFHQGQNICLDNHQVLP